MDHGRVSVWFWLAALTVFVIAPMIFVLVRFGPWW